MKREIKFKTWDSINKEWCLGDDDNGERSEFISIKSLVEQNAIGITDDGQMCNSLEWFQYTGLKDKNGKEIYEGDIVNYTRLTTMMDGLITYKLLIPSLDNHSDWLRITLHMRCIEVIGNISENPDLIPKQ